MKILIADDDLTSRISLTEVLKKHGHDVIAAQNGAEAWLAIQKDPSCKLVILDWMMPDIDGPELCRLIRDQKKECPPYIIILTAKKETKDIIVGLDAGADDFISKPFDPGELKSRINVGQRIINIQKQLAEKIKELSNAHAQIKTLHGIIPICCNCKKIREDSGYWNQVEVYVKKHTDANFSHGICPDCMKKLYPQYVKED